MYKVGDKLIVQEGATPLLKLNSTYVVLRVELEDEGVWLNVGTNEQPDLQHYQVWPGRFQLVNEVKPESKNNGGNTDYYSLPGGAVTLNDLIEHKNMSFALGNIMKAAYRLGEKDNTSALYDLNKIVYYAERMIKQLGKQNNKV